MEKHLIKKWFKFWWEVRTFLWMCFNLKKLQDILQEYDSIEVILKKIDREDESAFLNNAKIFVVNFYFNKVSTFLKCDDGKLPEFVMKRLNIITAEIKCIIEIIDLGSRVAKATVHFPPKGEKNFNWLFKS
ncbi:MAG: hypothetical protein V1860_04020 [bacterium]